ncbi:hypothetical protein THRCLA_20342 [Thraustotheca clavata]|uniref:Uncharacterized protein n=1 Tax=Thraustotheca clavata TaxID=74557 RepID=A0A1W0A8Q0_9STRA|nr:hypothetical protein THRCLA_20342 [Thraustotheca clavata]
MSSGYEWASSAEAFLAATSGRRGYTPTPTYNQCGMHNPLALHMQYLQPPCQSYSQESTPTSIDTLDMEVYVTDTNGPMVNIVSKRKLRDDDQEMVFKRQRMHCYTMETIQDTTMGWNQDQFMALSTFITLDSADDTMDILHDLMLRKPYTIRLPTPLIPMHRERDLSSIVEEDE